MLVRRFLMQIRYAGTQVPAKTRASSKWQSAFGKYLLFTNTWTSGALMVAGDLIEQEIEYQRNIIEKRYDWVRVGNMFVTGLIMGPLHHYFYGWMDKILPKRSVGSVTQKIMLDQLIMSPACIALLFYSMGTLEGKSSSGSIQELKEKFIDIYMVDWCVWPPVQFLNFYFIPVKYQVLYINSVTMLYNVFLSYVKHQDSVPDYTVLQVEDSS